jgi:hypothetical protein
MTKEEQKTKWTKRKNVPEVTENWQNFIVITVVQDFQVSCNSKNMLFSTNEQQIEFHRQPALQVLETPYDEKVVANIFTVL